MKQAKFANLDVIFILKYFCLLFLNATQKLHINFKQINNMLYPIDLNIELNLFLSLHFL